MAKDQTTPQIRYICQTGIDPGSAVDNNPNDLGPDPPCIKPFVPPNIDCFDLTGKLRHPKGLEWVKQS